VASRSQAREIAHQAEEAGQTAQAEAVTAIIEDILARPEHQWYEAAKKLMEEGKVSLIEAPGANAPVTEAASDSASPANDNAKPDGDAAKSNDLD